MQRILIWAFFGTFLVAQPVLAQRKMKSDGEFLSERPRIGESLPSVVVYDAQGKEVSTSSLRGHYTVLTFGCLT